MRKKKENNNSELYLRLRIVTCNILVKSTQQNHAHHEGQEEHNHKGVDQAEPVNGGVKSVQIAIPASRPGFFTFLPADIICVGHVHRNVVSKFNRIVVKGVTIWQTLAVEEVLLAEEGRKKEV